MFEYNDLANFIGSKLSKTDGYNLQERIEQKIEQYKQSGVDLTEEGAVEEIVADSMFTVFENEQYVHDLFEQHESLGEKIASRLKNFVQELKQLAKNLKSPEARAMAKQEAETVDKLAKMFNDAANMAMAKRYVQTMQEKNGKEGAQYQLKDSDGNIVELTEQQIEDNKKTVANMDTVATVTGNQFAEGYNKTLVNNIDQYFEKIGRMARNKVLGDVQLSKSGARHLVVQRATKRRRALVEAIKPVIEHGELVHIENEHKGNNFDTAIIAAPVGWKTAENENAARYYVGVIVRQSGANNDNTYYFHDAVLADENGGLVAASPNKENKSDPLTATKTSTASVLASIAKYNGQNGQNAFSIKEIMMEDNTGDILTTDQAKYFANSQIRDDQGRLKVMYRGDATDFNVFERKKSKGSNLYGRGFYFTDSRSHAGQYGITRAFYLDVQHALNAKTAVQEIGKEQMRAYLEAVAENEDYGLENYGYDATVESVLNGLWGQSDFAMLQDINATAIGDFVAAIELFNDVNGTNYDGIVTPTETVIFKSEQAKLTSNKQPTGSTDIRYSLKEYSDSELENWKDSKSIEVYTDRVQGMNFINKAMTDRSFRGKLYFGKIDTELAAAIEEAAELDVEDYNLALHADEVRKITESHGNEASENLRGQSAITVNDLLDIPEVVKHATKITAGEYEGHEAIVFVREQGNRTTTVTYMVNKKHDLRVQTMYKSNKKRGLSTAYSVQAEHFTSETDPRYSPSGVNVAQGNRNVKNQFSLKEDTVCPIYDNVPPYHKGKCPEGYNTSISKRRLEVSMIRKVELSMDEQQKYEVIKALADHPNPNKQRAALILQCTVRHINRMLKGYTEQGKAYFAHGNRGRKPANTIPAETRRLVVDLYRSKYYGANFEHFTELLAKHEGIRISPSAAMSMLEAECILSPKATKAKKKRFKKQLTAAKEAAKTQKEADQIQKNLVAVEDAHSRRPRAAYFGELEQMDATPYEWVSGQIWHLHLAIDDATGIVTGAWFDTQETLQGYYHVCFQVLTDYGIPYKFLTDRRTVFTYKKKNAPSIDEDAYTQFGYSCKQLGVELESSSVPQAKGRVERLNQTLQSRLPVELRLAGITTINAANEFLKSYIKEFNEKFALPMHDIKSVFEERPEIEKINLRQHRTIRRQRWMCLLRHLLLAEISIYTQ